MLFAKTKLQDHEVEQGRP